jgi:putative FmdB family regulatory protein
VPTYQYACTACGHRFDAVQSFSDASLTDCPECAGRLRKVFSSVGIVFKGSGFYRTDSRSSNGEKSGDTGKSDGGSSTKDGGKDGGTSTSTPAAKSDAGSSGTSGSSGSSTSKSVAKAGAAA